MLIYYGILIILIILIWVYLNQEKLIFIPTKLEKKADFFFTGHTTEHWFEVDPGVYLNGILFTTKEAKGLIFYLHGNANSVREWGMVSETYLRLGYDVFIIDYRGYGKSDGNIESEEQLFRDMFKVYIKVNEMNRWDKIIIVGCSIGTCLAAYLGSKFDANVILLSPYYSLERLIQEKFYVPGMMIRYKLNTNEYVRVCKRVVIFHGIYDTLISVQHSKDLIKECIRGSLHLIDAGHNGIDHLVEYQQLLKKYL